MKKIEQGHSSGHPTAATAGQARTEAASSTGWLQYSLRVSGESCEVGWQLFNRHLRNVSLEKPPDADEAVLRGYVRDDGSDARARFEVMLELIRAVLDVAEAEVTDVAPQSWGEAWKAHFPPIRVGKRLLLKPSWTEVDAGPTDVVVNFDPRMAFGTGHHPTTRLCLEMLEGLDAPVARVLDVGTGSAILTLAALGLGAGTAVALDTDPEAVREALDNASRSGLVGRLQVAEGGLPHALVSHGEFDLALMNITVHVVDLLLPDLASALRPGGQAIISGFQDKDVERIERSARAAGFEVAGRRTLDDWAAFLLTRA